MKKIMMSVVILVCAQMVSGQDYGRPYQDPNSPYLPDPSGSRTGQVYARRYRIESEFQVENTHLRSEQLKHQTVSAVMIAAANTVHVTIVDPDMASSHQAIQDIYQSGDYNTRLGMTPRPGGGLPMTDRLKLYGVLSYKVNTTRNHIEAAGASYDKVDRTEVVTFTLGGRVVSVETNALPYSIPQFTVSRVFQSQGNRNIRVDQPQRRSRIPFLDRIGAIGQSANFSSHELELIEDCIEAAAYRLVNQLEWAPALLVPPIQLPPAFNSSHDSGDSERQEQVVLELIDADMDNPCLVYLEVKQGRVNLGQTVLIPATKGATRGILKGTVTRGGQAGQIAQITLKRWGPALVLDKTRAPKAM